VLSLNPNLDKYTLHVLIIIRQPYLKDIYIYNYFLYIYLYINSYIYFLINCYEVSYNVLTYYIQPCK